MITCYISHPFTGDEKKNREDAARLQAELQTMFPDTVFINPIANFAALRDMRYEAVMRYCVNLLLRCDSVVFTGKYKDSIGCRIERTAAEDYKKPVFFYIEGEWKNRDE